MADAPDLRDSAKPARSFHAGKVSGEPMLRPELKGMLVCAVLLRIHLAYAGGQYYVQDEIHHFRPAWDAIDVLHKQGLAGWPDASKALLSQSIQCGYRVWSMLAGLMVLGVLGDWSREHLWIVAALLGMASIGVACATGRLARQLGADADEARCATLLTLASVAMLQWSRHFMPYDCGLWLCLIALTVAFREPTAARAMVVGFAI